MISRREQRLIVRILRRRWLATRRLLHERRHIGNILSANRERLVVAETESLEREAHTNIIESWGGT